MEREKEIRKERERERAGETEAARQKAGKCRERDKSDDKRCRRDEARDRYHERDQPFLFDCDGHIFSLLIQFNSLKLNLINIYAPNTVSDRKTFFEQLHHYFLSQGDYVIAGTFNCVDRTIDKFHSDDFHFSDKNSLAALKADFSLVDVYHKLNPH